MSHFKILSLDGGGIRGAFSAEFLATVEDNVGSPLGQYFDLIVGTSTGGIIAAALALGASARDVSKMYQEHGPEIFSRQRLTKATLGRRWQRSLAAVARWAFDRWLTPHGADVHALLQPKYGAAPLETALRQVLGDQKIGDAQTRLVLPTVDLAAGRVVVFKTPHLPEAATRDRHYSAVQAALCTSAAPTYFPHATISPGSAFCDGGVWANNPSVVAYAEALKISDSCNRPGVDPTFAATEIFMLSVGTGETRFSLAPSRSSAGIGWWAPKRIIDVTLFAQAQGAHTTARYLLGADRLHRVDFLLPDSSWGLDSVNHLEKLANFGQLAAHERLSKLRPIFFTDVAPRFTPFPASGVPTSDSDSPSRSNLCENR